MAHLLGGALQGRVGVLRLRRDLFCGLRHRRRCAELLARRQGDLFDLGDDVVDVVTDRGDLLGRFGRVGCAATYGVERALHVLDGLARFTVHAFDHAGDLHRRLAGALGELAHFIGDDGEAAPLLTGASGFDRGVEGQKVGLVGDFLDHADDAADFLGTLAEAVEHGRERFDLLRRFAGFIGDAAHGGDRGEREGVGVFGELVGVLRAVGDVRDADGDFLDRGGILGGQFGQTLRVVR